jgi:pimeloyl-ACP methyl ester carboxylesterase
MKITPRASFLAVIVATGAAYAGADVRQVDIGDAVLTYVEQGRGEPVILIHGGMQDYRLWLPHMKSLSKRYRVIAYSRRNHYPGAISPDGWPDTAADLHADDLARLINALGLGRVHLVAHSSGAHAALFFAAMHTEVVRSLAVNEPPASGLLAASSEGLEIGRLFGEELAPSRDAFRQGDLPNGVRMFTDAVSGPGVFEGRSRAVREMMMANAVAHQADARSQRPRAAFTCDMARRVTAPTLISNGDRSPGFFHAVTDQLAACIPHNERLTFHASHTAPLEDQRAYDAAILGWLQRH